MRKEKKARIQHAALSVAAAVIAPGLAVFSLTSVVDFSTEPTESTFPVVFAFQSENLGPERLEQAESEGKSAVRVLPGLRSDRLAMGKYAISLGHKLLGQVLVLRQ